MPINQFELKQDIHNLSLRIAQLKFLSEQKFSEINILLEFTDSAGEYRMKGISQDVIPFSLQGEIKLLLEDSIIELERQLDSLKSLVIC